MTSIAKPKVQSGKLRLKVRQAFLPISFLACKAASASRVEAIKASRLQAFPTSKLVTLGEGITSIDDNTI